MRSAKPLSKGQPLDKDNHVRLSNASRQSMSTLCTVLTKSLASVSLEPLKGTWWAEASSARMHSFSASRLLLICAPSILVCLHMRDTHAAH